MGQTSVRAEPESHGCPFLKGVPALLNDARRATSFEERHRQDDAHNPGERQKDTQSVVIDVRDIDFNNTKQQDQARNDKSNSGTNAHQFVLSLHQNYRCRRRLRTRQSL